MNGNFVHGFNNKNCRLHVTWQNMKRRCLDKKNKKYSSYGGSGISIFHEWLEFIPFMNWAIDNDYNDKLTIDRKDNEKGYFPDNCRFVGISTQNANKKITSKNNSGYIGVSVHTNGKFRVKVYWKKKTFNLGYFDCAKEAAKIRDAFIINNKLPHTLNFK